MPKTPLKEGVQEAFQSDKPPQLTSFDVEEQHLYFMLPPDGGPPHPISKAETGHPMKEAHCNQS